MAGGKVVLSEGTFALSAAILIARNNVAISGQGRATSLLDSVGGSIAGIDVSGFRSGLTVAHLDLDGFAIGLSLSGITDLLCLDVHARNCTSQAFGGPNEYITAGRFIACKAVGNTGDGFVIGMGSNQCHLIGCIADDNNVGLVLDFCIESTIIGCTSKDNTSHGLQLENGPDRCIVADNVFSGNGGWGIYHDGAGVTACPIHDNQVYNNTSGGISVPNATVRNNPGHITENSGTSTGTGAQQTIAHGLAAAPNRVYFSDIEQNANAYQSAAADAVNIYITAVLNQDYVWKAEVV